MKAGKEKDVDGTERSSFSFSVPAWVKHSFCAHLLYMLERRTWVGSVYCLSNSPIADVETKA